MAPLCDALGAVVQRRWAGAGQFWQRAAREVEAPRELGFRSIYASVPRRLGTDRDVLMGATLELGEAARPHWTLTDYVRAWLMAQALIRLQSAMRPGFVLDLFEGGELGEQVSLLRTLSLWTAPETLLETAVQACRTNARPVFEAIVCENLYLARYFPDLSFNQAVMKALFVELPVARIEGLGGRITPELVRMAADYRSERVAAGRAVPIDVDYLIRYGG